MRVLFRGGPRPGTCPRPLPCPGDVLAGFSKGGRALPRAPGRLPPAARRLVPGPPGPWPPMCGEGEGTICELAQTCTGGPHERRALAAEKNFGKLKTCF